MGHVINPSAMRVGTLYYWEDLWYKQHLYYPEFLHQIFKMRLFLTSFFGFKLFENKNIFFSHFYFVYQNKSLLVRIFLYFGYLEYFFNNFNLESTLIFNSIRISFLSLKKKSLLNFFLFLNLFLKINLKNLINWKKIFIKFFIKKEKYFLKYLIANKKIKKNIKKIFLFFYFIFLNEKYFLNDLFKLWFLLAKYFILKPKFSFVKFFIDNFLSYLFNINNLSSSIFSVSNENLNAKFLSRFIARRLQQGFSIKHVVRPIIKDLLITNKNSIMGSLIKKDNLILIKDSFIKYLKKYWFLFKVINLNNRNSLNSWITIEYFNLFLIIKKRLKYSIVIQLFKLFWKNFISYNYYLNYNILNYYFLENNNDKYFEYLFNSIVSSKKLFFNFEYIFLNNLIKNISFFFLNWFLKLQYLNFYSNKIYYKNDDLNVKKAISILGFKFHFVGRFSRKQRASSIWYMQGKMPLNTLNANIEFASYIIPLLNSAVRVKVYINRGTAYKEYFLKIV